MSTRQRVGYLLLILLLVLPIGLRWVTWRPHHAMVDVAMAAAGKELFEHIWTPKDNLSPDGDGLGPVYNATSCRACHFQGGVGGSGGLGQNVTAFTVRSVADGPSIRSKPEGAVVREGVVHAYSTAPKYQETLSQVHPQLPTVIRPKLGMLVSLPAFGNRDVPQVPGVHLSQRNTPALFGTKEIDELPERIIISNQRKQWLKWGLASPDSEETPVGRVPRLANGRIGRFGWKAQTGSLAEFVQAACANELGLGNPDHPQPTPLGAPGYVPVGLDLTRQQCDQLTAFVAALPRPIEWQPEDSRSRELVEAGRKVFREIGCADCHTPDLGDVQGIYSDLLLHPMGKELVGGGSYGQQPIAEPDLPVVNGAKPSEWRTPPLWGVADSAPYLHDGRAGNLDEAIRMHGGQGSRAAVNYRALGTPLQAELLAFLKTLRAP
jgi:CxxC motif-containing protein (DUF1111 family)